jgi:hypothetical protein
MTMMGIFGPSSEVTTKDAITLLIAIYSAVLSTFVFLRSIGKDRKRIKLFVTNEGDFTLDCAVTNVGAITVVVNVPKIVLQNGIFYNFDPGYVGLSFPYKLTPGEQIYVNTGALFKATVFAGKLKQLQKSGRVVMRIVCTDTPGKVYKTRKFLFLVPI